MGDDHVASLSDCFLEDRLGDVNAAEYARSYLRRVADLQATVVVALL